MEAASSVSAGPRVVLGMPAYNRPDTLAASLESLLSQTYSDFALVIVDDARAQASRTVVERYASEFPRVTYEANPRRLGMVGNWRKVFTRARQMYPRSEYFAWVSDHDLWHARWLRELVSVLDANPELVLVYPRNLRMRTTHMRVTEKTFDTLGLRSPEERIRTSARQMLSGDMIYGLVRAEALERAGVFRRVMTPDRQVLLALSLLGQVKQVPEVLWYREFREGFGLRRQRDAFFPDGAPLYAYLPTHLQHCAALVWDFAVCGRGRPRLGRLAAARCAVLQLWWSVVRDVVRPKLAWRMALSRYAPGRWIVALLPTAGERPATAVKRPPPDAVALERKV
jgi:glycosyltransferase involved in cell wall biosynthesis